MGRFFGDELAGRLEGIDDVVVAVYCEYESDHTGPYTFLLGRRIAPDAVVPDGLVRRQTPQGECARFLAEGEQPAALIETWGRISKVPLRRRYDHDYELHTQNDARRAEIFVGV